MSDTTTARLLPLGEPRLLREGLPITFRTRKSLPLLCYLAVSPGHYPRERLLTLLWPAAQVRHSGSGSEDVYEQRGR